MKRFREEQAAAWREHDVEFACVHGETALRRRVVKGGAVQFVMQCLRCGDAMPNPISRTAALARCNGFEPPAFDDAIKARWEAAVAGSAERIRGRFGAGFWSGYGPYLASPQWAERRRLVMERAGGLCEGCRVAPADEVHHLTYDHVGDEFLFELVAVCGCCHDRLHSDA